MKKIASIFIFTLLAILTATGCTLKKPIEEAVVETTGNAVASTQGQTATGQQSIQRTEQDGDVTVTIDVSTPLAEAQSPRKVTLDLDQESFLRMGNELLEERFPQAAEILATGEPGFFENTPSGNLVISYDRETREDRVGWMGFLDGENNINGKMLDADFAPGTPDYITEISVPGLDFSGEEAAQRVAELLEQYSCFTFSPWNVYAVYEAETQRGFYKVTLRPCFEGMPLYSQDKITTLSVGYSASGMFECQGILLLKEAQSVLLENSLSVEDAVEVFLSSSPLYAYGEAVFCNRIFRGYVTAPADNAVTLSPAWIFECTDTGMSGSYFCAVDMGSGTLLNVG